jgi:flagellar motility protein MotE (MotC chaperone)
MRGGFRQKKDPFDMLTGEEKDAVASMSPEEIRNRIAKAAMDQAALEEAQKNDGDLQEKKAAVKYAMEPYRDGKKRLKQLIKYARTVLDAQGKDSGTSPTEE